MHSSHVSSGSQLHVLLLTLRVGYLVGSAVTGRFFSAGGCHEGRIDGRHSINLIVGLGLMIVDGLDPIFGSP